MGLPNLLIDLEVFLQNSAYKQCVRHMYCKYLFSPRGLPFYSLVKFLTCKSVTPSIHFLLHGLWGYPSPQGNAPFSNPKDHLLHRATSSCYKVQEPRYFSKWDLADKGQALLHHPCDFSTHMKPVQCNVDIPSLLCRQESRYPRLIGYGIVISGLLTGTIG